LTIEATPKAARTPNQSSATGPKSAPMRAVPRLCARNSAVKTARAIGTVHAARAGVATSMPSMAERTEIAGVMTPSP